MFLKYAMFHLFIIFIPLENSSNYHISLWTGNLHTGTCNTFLMIFIDWYVTLFIILFLLYYYSNFATSVIFCRVRFTDRPIDRHTTYLCVHSRSESCLIRWRTRTGNLNFFFSILTARGYPSCKLYSCTLISVTRNMLGLGCVYRLSQGFAIAL